MTAVVPVRSGVVLVALAAAIVLVQDRGASSTRSGSMTPGEVERAADAVRAQIDGTDAVVDRVTVHAVTGTVDDANVGRPCTSGRLLEVTVSGSFPRIVTTGTPAMRGSTDTTVRALLLTVDAVSGAPCLLGVGTTAPAPSAADVEIDLRRR